MTPHWVLFAIFLSSPQGVTETYFDKEDCISALQEMRLIAKKDFFVGVCRNTQDEDDYVEVSTEIAP